MVNQTHQVVSTPSLINIPIELTEMILENLDSTDLMSLRCVSRSFRALFTSEGICTTAFRTFFPFSYARYKEEPGNNDNFDTVYRRHYRWKSGRPSNVEHVQHDPENLIGPYGSMPCCRRSWAVNSDVLIYTDAPAGVVVLKELGKNYGTEDIRVDLEELLGVPLKGTYQRLGGKAGSGIHARHGVLLVTKSIDAPIKRSEATNFLFVDQLKKVELANWHTSFIEYFLTFSPDEFAPYPSSALIREFLGTSASDYGADCECPTLCATFSLHPDNRGSLLHTWVDFQGRSLSRIALNKFYVISATHGWSTRLNGFIYPTSAHPGLRFVLCLNLDILQHSTGHFKIAPDTKGKCFFVYYSETLSIDEITGHREEIPVVEVFSVPQFDPITGGWSGIQVLKRVQLRSILNHTRIYFAEFDFEECFDFDAEERDWHGIPGMKKKRGGEFDVVRVRYWDPVLSACSDSVVLIRSVTWDISSKPWPLQQSLQGQKRLSGGGLEYGSSSYGSINNVIDFDDIYPPPTYYYFGNEQIPTLRWLSNPGVIDLEREEYEGNIAVTDVPEKLFDTGSNAWYLYDTYSSNQNYINASVFLRSEDGIIELVPPGKQDDNPYPNNPGTDDADFVPNGTFYGSPRYVISWKVTHGRDGDPWELTPDYRGRRYIVFRRGKIIDGLYKTFDSIMILRFD